jgi:hypothetical protein
MTYIRPWVKKVCMVDQIEGNRDYFLGFSTGDSEWLFLGHRVNGKAFYTKKPGMADRYSVDDGLVALMKRYPSFRAIEVPDDHAKRWKTRLRWLAKSKPSGV